MRTAFNMLLLPGFLAIAECSSPVATPHSSTQVIVDTSGHTPLPQVLTFSHARVVLDSVTMFHYYGYSGRRYNNSTGRLEDFGSSDSSIVQRIDTLSSVTYSRDTSVTISQTPLTVTSTETWLTSDNRHASKTDTIILDPVARRIRVLASATLIANNDPTNYKENRNWVRLTDVPYILDAHGHLTAELPAVSANTPNMLYGESSFTHESAAVQSRSSDVFVRFTDPSSQRVVRIVLE